MIMLFITFMLHLKWKEWLYFNWIQLNSIDVILTALKQFRLLFYRSISPFFEFKALRAPLSAPMTDESCNQFL